MLVTIAWVFFRAGSLSEAAVILNGMWQFTPSVLTDGTLYQLGLDRPNFLLMVAGLLLLIWTDICNYRKIRIAEQILEQGIWLRFLIGIGAVLVILLCGIWGPGYDASSFIYYKF